MIEYPDGSFGEIECGQDALTRFTELFENNVPIKALHFGTVEELQAIKEEKPLKDRVDILAMEVAALKPIISGRIKIPSPKEVLDYAGVKEALIK